MSVWPSDYEKEWTIANPISLRGIGLHTGVESEVHLLPIELPGLYISFLGSDDSPIKLEIEQVRNSQLCTTLELNQHHLSTVEHLFAAVVGCGLTHLHIKVSGDEIPLLDGSSLNWVEAIKEAGIVPASSPRARPPIINESFVINRGCSVISVIPDDKLRIIGIIDFPYRAIGQQMFSIELTPQKFVNEIAPARTFGFKDQLNELKQTGLIKGGNLENALVCDGDNWLNPPLRFQDEPVRHKILDLIGDLALVGLPKAQIIVYRGSHGLHADLASTIASTNSFK